MERNLTFEDEEKGYNKGKNNPMYGKENKWGKHTEETKNKIRKTHLGKNNPMYGKTHSKETKNKISDWFKKNKNTLKMRERNKKISEMLKEKFKEGKLKSLKYWLGKHIIFSEEHKKKISNALKGKNNPAKRLEVREKISLSRKGKHSSPETEFKKGDFNEQIKKAKEKLKIKPNNPEQIMIDIIKENNLPFNYVGNGQVIIGGFNPDFLSKNPKYIIEVNGDYWHNLPNIKEKDNRKYLTYEKYGYKTLVIWENELKNPIQILNKIKEFLNG